MPVEPVLSDIHMGLMELTLDGNGQITEWIVSKLFDVVVEGVTTTVGKNVDVWPSFTQGQKNQAQNLIDSIQEFFEA